MIHPNESNQLNPVTDEELAKVEAFSKSRDNASVLVIFFDDMERSTAQKQQMTEALDEEAFQRLRREHDAILTAIITRDKVGEVIKSTGDGLLAVFSEPSTAVERALEIQDKLHKHPYLSIRIGLNMGQVRTEGAGGVKRDVFGLHVDCAARVESMAEGGHILVTGSVYPDAFSWIHKTRVAWKKHGFYRQKEGEPVLEVFEPYNANIITPMQTLHGTKVPSPVLVDIPQKASVSKPKIHLVVKGLKRFCQEHAIASGIGIAIVVLFIIITMQKYDFWNQISVPSPSVEKSFQPTEVGIGGVHTVKPTVEVLPPNSTKPNTSLDISAPAKTDPTIPTALAGGGFKYEEGISILWAATFSRDSRRVIALFSGFTGKNKQNPFLRTWDLDNLSKTTKCSISDYVVPYAVGFSIDRHLMLVGLNYGGFALIDVDTCHQLLKFDIKRITDIIFLPDGRRAFVAGSDDFQLWDLTVPNAVKRVAGQFGKPFRVASSPDGQRLIVVGASPEIGGSNPTVIACLDVESLRELWRYECSDSEGLGLAVSPDSQRVLTGGRHGVFRMLDMATGRSLAIWNGPDSFIRGLTFSADGRKAYSGSNEGVLRIWDSTSGTLLGSHQVFANELNTIHVVELSADGRHVLAGSNDALFVWAVSE